MPAPPAGGSPSPPAPWRGKDVGDVVTARGQSICVPSTCRFQFGGRDIGGAADSFYFVHQPVRGAGELVATFQNMDAAPMAKVGLMVRASLDPGAPSVFVGLVGDPDSTLARVVTRRSAGAVAESMSYDLRARAVWLRIARNGPRVTVYRGPAIYQGPPWTEIAAFDLPDLPPEALFGFAMEGHADGQPSLVDFVHGYLNDFGEDPALSAQWTHADVRAFGGTALLGDGGKIALAGWGDAALSDREMFTYLFKRGKPTQTVRVTARLVATAGPAATGRAGVSVRDTGPNTGSVGNSNNPGAWLYASPGGGVTFEARGFSGASKKVMSLPDLKPPVWLRVERVPMDPDVSVFSASVSRDGAQWTPAGSITMPMFKVAAGLTAGLFATSGSEDMLDTADFDNVTVEATP